VKLIWCDGSAAQYFSLTGTCTRTVNTFNQYNGIWEFLENNVKFRNSSGDRLKPSSANSKKENKMRTNRFFNLFVAVMLVVVVTLTVREAIARASNAPSVDRSFHTPPMSDYRPVDRSFHTPPMSDYRP
jgi:hypothetical protein